MKCNAPGNYHKGRKHPNKEDRAEMEHALYRILKRRGLTPPQDILRHTRGTYQ